MKNKRTSFSVIESLVVLILVLAMLSTLIIAFGQSPQVSLLIVMIVLMFYGYIRGFSWNWIMAGLEEGIKPGIMPLIIFLLIGVLIASWIFSGTIPTIMYFGFKILSARFFLPTIFIVCSLVAIASGSSFTTISTMGIAFIGIGIALKFNPGLVAGAIVSGAYFGANVSPLSGTTNLAAGIAKVNLYEHIKGLLITDLPAWVIVGILYTILGLNASSANLQQITTMMGYLHHGFWISAWTLLPILLLIAAAWIKMPAIPSLALGSVIGVILGWIHQPNLNQKVVANYIMNGYIAHTGNHQMNVLLSKGGISSMLSSLALIIFALALGGLLVKFKVISVLLDHISKSINTTGRLIFMAALTSIGVNYLIGEQYLSIILSGETFKKAFEKKHTPARYLSRVLNVAGAAVNAIVPWGVSGVFVTSTLQVNALKFIPFSFFCWLIPITTIIVGYFVSKKSTR